MGVNDDKKGEINAFTHAQTMQGITYHINHKHLTSYKHTYQCKDNSKVSVTMYQSNHENILKNA